jgi:hypothetical protein
VETPITISFKWSAKEVLLAQGTHMRYSKQGRKFRWLFIGGGVLFIILGIVGLARQQGFFTSAFPFFLFAAVFFAMPLFMRRAVLKPSTFFQIKKDTMHLTKSLDRHG